jgi:hypothetical protein
MYWSGLVLDQFFFNHSLFSSFAGAGDSIAVTLQADRDIVILHQDLTTVP